MTTMTASSAYILFVDHQGHVAPLGRCYHATASRRLSSSIERHPPSTQTEIDSAFCPHCLSFHDAASASQLGYCPKTTCQHCPQCQSVASVVVENEKCYYACGYCDWNSISIGLHSPCKDESEVKAATEALGKDLLDRRSMKVQEDQYQSTLQSLEAVAVDELRRRKQPNLITKDPDYDRMWSMEALTTSLEDRKTKPPSSKGLGVPVDENPPLPLNNTSSVQSLLLSPNQLPLPIPLVPRTSRRCRAELAEGRPGILLKPKLNPLEGDTSLRSGHGQWYKKDSSAILVLPRVAVERTDGNFVLLSVHNPTLGVVKLSMEPSNYQGEPDFEDPTSRRTTPVLSKILVDSLRGTALDKDVTLDTSFQLESSDVIALEAVEDTFLELGGQGAQLPEQVKSWSAGTGGGGWIAQKGDKAWFAFELIGDDTECIPLAMKIVIAKGSWESSLIKQNGDNDSVTFDMVLIRTTK